jgi:hypothetical protein
MDTYSTWSRCPNCVYPIHYARWAKQRGHRARCKSLKPHGLVGWPSTWKICFAQCEWYLRLHPKQLICSTQQAAAQRVQCAPLARPLCACVRAEEEEEEEELPYHDAIVPLATMSAGRPCLQRTRGRAQEAAAFSARSTHMIVVSGADRGRGR